jgi:hypothetical protein
MPMLRYAVLGLFALVANSAWAQQAAPTAEAPATSDAPASARPEDSIKPENAVVTMEEPLQGDHWTYQVRDEITGAITATNTSVVTEVTATDISVRTRTAGTAVDGLIVYDRSWNLISSGQWRYSPSDGTGIRMPLAAGKTWTFQSNQVNAEKGYSFNRSGTSKVVGQETVTTRAGTFESFKIETAFSLRNVKDPTGKEEMTSVTWYAPAINHWVKRVFTSRSDQHLRYNNSIELVGYGRKE